MKKIKLTGKRGGYALVDDEDFEMLSKFNWNNTKNGYPSRYLLNESFVERPKRYTRQYMHTLIMGSRIKEGFVIDHINRNKLDNRKKNLRFLDFSQSMLNRKIHSNNTSGHKGVYWHKAAKKYMVEVQYRNTKYYLGLFAKKEDAIKKVKEFCNYNLDYKNYAK